MRKTLLATALLSALGASSAAFAQSAPDTTQHKEGQHVIPASSHTVSYNVGLASEYSYRGISQSDNDPALSGGIDYSHASGLYLGTWVSTISWLEDAGVYADSKVEVDIYGGFKLEVAKDLVLDLGVLRYEYPGDEVAGTTSPNTTEVYGAVNYKMVSLKYSHSTTNLFGFADSKGSGYLELNANVDIAEGTQLNLHVGKQTVKNVAADAADYTDYKLGVTKDFGIVAASVAYVKTTGNATDAAKGTIFEDWFKGRGVVTISKAF